MRYEIKTVDFTCKHRYKCFTPNSEEMTLNFVSEVDRKFYSNNILTNDDWGKYKKIYEPFFKTNI
jgi:hypothetical protein